MDTYFITTYGAGEILHTTFNALAALMNSKTGTLYQPLVRFALLIGLMWVLAQMVYGDRAKFLTQWTVPFYLALTLFFAPTCTVQIHDPVTHERFKVDHVPWGLGAVAGIVSKIGDHVTREIEKTFSLPDDLKYHKTGSVMASNLIAKARTFRIVDADLSETLRSFVNQCVVYDALVGRKYTLEDLKNSADIWGLVSTNASPARSFVYKTPGKGKDPEIITCAEGVKRLDPLLQTQMENAFQYFEGKIFGKKADLVKDGKQPSSKNLGNDLKHYLPGAFNYMTQMAKSASDYMMQQMMIHTVVDAVESKSTALGNAPDFAVRRAYLQQRANQETLAGIAGHKLIAMKNVMEALIYVAFIFILPMALLPLGWRFISKWVGLVMWVQLWAPLYAILNFIMNITARAKGVGALSDASGVTIANSVGFMDLHADMAAQAGFMSLAVGSLAYALVRGGAASFVHLAGHMAGPAMSAAASATESLMTGNYSFGNVSQGGIQAHNTSFGQHMLSPSYASGAFTQNDGIVSRTTTSDGQHILGVSNSNLRSTMNFSESLSTNYSEQASHAAHMSQNESINAAESLSHHSRQVMDLTSHMAQQSSHSDQYSYGTSAQQSQTFSQLDGMVNKFAKDHNISKEEASQFLAKASASIQTGVGFNLFGTGATTNISGDLLGTSSNTMTDRETISAAQDFARQSQFQSALNQASQLARESRYSDLSDKGQRLAEGISASYEKAQHHRQEAAAHLNKSQNFSKMASWTEQHASSINANLNQEYVNWLQNQSLPNSSGAMGIHEAETILTSRPTLDQSYQQRFMEEKLQDPSSIFGSHNLPSSEGDIQKVYESVQPNIPNNVDSEGMSSVAEAASNQGLGDMFKVDSSMKNRVTEKLSDLEDQLIEQKELIQQQGKNWKLKLP